MKTTAPAAVIPHNLCTLSCDVGAEKLNLAAPALARPGFSAEWAIENRSEPIRELVELTRRLAVTAGFQNVRVVVEPTGIYHELLLHIARSLGCDTNLVNPSHVVKMREVRFGSRTKTDRRDPLAIDAVVGQGRLIRHRQLPEPYALLRHWSKLYDDAERSVIDAKSRIHRVLKRLFPDFSFKPDFLYGPSGRAILRCFGLNPHRIAETTPARLLERLRRSSRIMRTSVDRLLANARASAASLPAGRYNEALEHELALAFEDLDRATVRKENARSEIESLYDEVRASDPKLPAPQKNVISKLALGRLVGEIGPLSDFQSWRQLARLGGLNLCIRESGKYVGLTKISRTGRVMMRVVLNHIALPLVKRGGLFGDYFHHKAEVQKMPGKKAMTAVSRKLLKMFWGWYQSGAAFDESRVFTSAGQLRAAA